MSNVANPGGQGFSQAEGGYESAVSQH